MNLKFTMKEWNFIRHCLECASRDFAKHQAESTESEQHNSQYQIFKRQTEEAARLAEKIENTPL